MLRTAAIALAICLARPTSASAEDAPAAVLHPKTFICDPPAWEGPPQPIPSGKQLKDLCPAGARAYLFISGPHLSAPPPLGLHTANPQPDRSKSP
jgi:hypothetical protein